MRYRHELTDEQWARLAPLLPPQKPHTGRPGKDLRTIINGIHWILRTGAPWRDLPARYGQWKTVYSRFLRWQQAGVWAKIWTALQEQADADGRFDWELHSVDGSVIRAHQHAAGAKGGTQKLKPSAAARAGSAPKSMSGLTARASRLSLS
jgi:transposase